MLHLETAPTWYFWLDGLLNVVIAIAYFIIPWQLLQFVRRKWTGIPTFVRWTLAIAGLFVYCCGMGHLLHLAAPLLFGNIPPLALFIPLLADTATALVSAKAALASPTVSKQVIAFLDRAENAEFAAADQENIFLAFQNETPDSVIAAIKDQEGRFLFASRSVGKLLDRPPEAILGLTDADLVSPAEAAVIMANDQRILRTGVQEEVVEKAVIGGESRSFMLVKFVVPGTNCLGVKGVDITSQVRLQESLASFAHVVSHDLRSPLTAIKGLAQLLETQVMAKFEPDDRELVALIQTESQHALNLINGILEFSQLDKFEVCRLWVDPAPLLREIKQRLDPQLAPLVATLTWDGLPRVYVSGTHLARALENLIVNAIKYRHPDRRLTIRVAVEETQAEWVFSVTDNGQGLAAKDLAEVFKPFFRLHSRQQAEGFGIGLAAVAKIAERHNGRAWAESDGKGCGSTFKFSLRRDYAIQSSDCG